LQTFKAEIGVGLFGPK